MQELKLAVQDLTVYQTMQINVIALYLLFFSNPYILNKLCCLTGYNAWLLRVPFVILVLLFTV